MIFYCKKKKNVYSKSMICTHPIYAYNYGLDSDTGKNHIKILPKRPDISTLQDIERRYGSEGVVPLPCGHCLACKVNYAKEWSVRCMLEASLYKDNWFLTLTYDDEHLPDGNKLDYSDVQKFLKLLRLEVPDVRFFCCGEYGSSTHRPHYHLILFNCSLPDLKCISKGRLGGYYFDSQLIKDCWKKGNITLGYVTPASCEYVARYCLKKVNGDEFVNMSLKPGIGAGYFDIHMESIYDTDGVYVDGKKYKVPRYFDKLLERVSAKIFVTVKNARSELTRSRRLALLNDTGFHYDEEAYEYQARANIGKFKDKLKKGSL